VAQRRSDKSLSDDQGEGLAVSFERSLPQAEAMGGEHRPDSVTKQELESYLAQYSAQNYINHRAALSNLFGYGLKVGAAPENPLSTIEKPRIRRARPPILSDTEFAALPPVEWPTWTTSFRSSSLTNAARSSA
jgi:site-specific recombinase XerD